MSTYLTPHEPYTASDLIVKKSRFIADIFPVKSAADADAALAMVRERHKSARHHCYAYIVDADGHHASDGGGVPVERFSDDGEPSGTAGRPMLEVLRRRGVSNAIAIVTRYFGGVLLGANGLVRAYADATARVLDEAEMLTCQWMQRMEIACSYGLFGKVEYELTQLGFVLLEKTFAEDVRFYVMTLVGDASQADPPGLDVGGALGAMDLAERLAHWSNGQAHWSVRPAEYVGVTADGQFIFGV